MPLGLGVVAVMNRRTNGDPKKCSRSSSLSSSPQHMMHQSLLRAYFIIHKQDQTQVIALADGSDPANKLFAMAKVEATLGHVPRVCFILSAKGSSDWQLHHSAYKARDGFFAGQPLDSRTDVRREAESYGLSSPQVFSGVVLSAWRPPVSRSLGFFFFGMRMFLSLRSERDLWNLQGKEKSQ